MCFIVKRFCYCAEYGCFVLGFVIIEIKLYLDTNSGLKGLSRYNTARYNKQSSEKPLKN